MAQLVRLRTARLVACAVTAVVAIAFLAVTISAWVRHDDAMLPVIVALIPLLATGLSVVMAIQAQERRQAPPSR